MGFVIDTSRFHLQLLINSFHGFFIKEPPIIVRVKKLIVEPQHIEADPKMFRL